MIRFQRSTIDMLGWAKGVLKLVFDAPTRESKDNLIFNADVIAKNLGLSQIT